MNQRTVIGGFLSITGAIIMGIFSYIMMSCFSDNNIKSIWSLFESPSIDLNARIAGIILLLAVIAGIILTVMGIRLLLIELSKSKKEDFKGNNIEKK